VVNRLTKPRFKMSVGGSPFDKVIVGTGIGIFFKLLSMLESFSGLSLAIIV